MSTPMLDSELNELTHMVADFLDKYTDTPIDRLKLNDKLDAMCEEFGIQIEED